MSQSGPSVSCTWTRYWIAFFEVRMPPAGFIPTRGPVSVVDVADRLEHHELHRAASRRPGSLPVDVLMKSAPAAIASSDARRTLS